MKDGFEFADELGPLKIIQVYEPSVGLRAILVVDNAAKGVWCKNSNEPYDIVIEQYYG